MPSSCDLPTCQEATYCSPPATIFANHLPGWTFSFYLLPKPLDSCLCHLFGFPSCWVLLQKNCLFSRSGPLPLPLVPSPDIYQRAFDFLSGCHCFLCTLMICAQWDLWKQLEKQNSPGEDRPDFLIHLQPCTASNSLTSSIASSLGKLPAPTFPDWFLSFFPFGFLLAFKTCKLHAYGLMPWISDSWLSRDSAVIWPSVFRLYLAQPASWPLPNPSY